MYLCYRRALQRAFSPSSLFALFILFLALVISGLLFLFCQSLALYMNPWLQLLFHYLPLFLSFPILMSAGILALKGRIFSRNPFFSTLYFSLPLLVAFLICWLLIGLFMMIKAIPFIGTFLGVVLAFAPYLLNVSILLLLLCGLACLFFFTPIIASKRQASYIDLKRRFERPILTNILSFALAIIPIWVVWKLLTHALFLTFTIYSAHDSSSIQGLQMFFILIPIAAFLTPPLLVFFLFSDELAFEYTEEKEVHAPK